MATGEHVTMEHMTGQFAERKPRTQKLERADAVKSCDGRIRGHRNQSAINPE